MADNDVEDRAEPPDEVLVRYWAAARSAAGVETERVRAATLADVLAEIRRRHADSDRFAQIIGICSVLVGETPVNARDPAEVALQANDTIEFLPPFAGGSGA